MALGRLEFSFSGCWGGLGVWEIWIVGDVDLWGGCLREMARAVGEDFEDVEEGFAEECVDGVIDLVV